MKCPGNDTVSALGAAAKLPAVAQSTGATIERNSHEFRYISRFAYNG